jgi:hypothetical protein
VLALLLMLLPALAQTPTSSMSRGSSVPVERAGGPFGIGLGVGAPSGFAGKMWIGQWSAVQFSVGGDLGVYGNFATTADYVLQFRPFRSGSRDVSVPVHIGGGINVSADTLGETFWQFGPRGVLGLSVMIKDLPVDIYVETAPTFYIVEYVTWSIDGQIGLRYYL